MENFKIITFYEFKDMRGIDLAAVRTRLADEMRAGGIKGTIILADEGFNSTVCGTREAIGRFVEKAGAMLGTTLRVKTSYHEKQPFRRVDVKIKPEIVTLKRPVDISNGAGTHVKPGDWNAVISRRDVVVLDARNDYEFRSGTFAGAVNPRTKKFSELPAFAAEKLDPKTHKKVAMFCTGGIRCEKFAPYLKQQGFEEVYQLEGGILKYLEEVPAGESLWEGECFVFDDRVTVDRDLKKGSGEDLSVADRR